MLLPLLSPVATPISFCPFQCPSKNCICHQSLKLVAQMRMTSPACRPISAKAEALSPVDCTFSPNCQLKLHASSLTAPVQITKVCSVFGMTLKSYSTSPFEEMSFSTDERPALSGIRIKSSSLTKIYWQSMPSICTPMSLSPLTTMTLNIWPALSSASSPGISGMKQKTGESTSRFSNVTVSPLLILIFKVPETAVTGTVTTSSASVCMMKALTEQSSAKVISLMRSRFLPSMVSSPPAETGEGR